MNTDDLAAALRACAAGLLPLEAGTELLISNGTFLHRDDFSARFITRGTSGGTPMAAIDWDAVIAALTAGSLPCSGGERRILQLAASLAAGSPASLRDTVTGLDQDNAARLLTAIRHAAGNRPLTSDIDRSATSSRQRPAFAATMRSRHPTPRLGYRISSSLGSFFPKENDK